jgi:hypothetical protein
MDKRRQTRYVIAIYVILASIAIILWILAFYEKDSFLQSTYLNLSTGFIGVVAVFFFVNLLFLVDDWQLSERVKNLLTRLEEGSSARDFFEKPQAIDTYIRSAYQIDLCGVTLTSAINKQLSNIRDRIKDGADVRVLVVNPLSLGLEMSTFRSENTDDFDYYKQKLETTFNDLEYLHKIWQDFKSQYGDKSKIGNFSVRLLSYAPSFSIFSFNANRSNGVLLTEIFPHHAGYGAPPTFSLKPERDGEWYQYYINQFEEMWKAATPWHPETEAQMKVAGAEIIGTNRKIRAEEFFLPENYLSSEIFATAKEICLLGYSLSRTVRKYTEVLSQRLAQGAQIRVIVVDPKLDEVLNRMALESIASTAEHWRNSIEATRTLLGAIVKSPGNTGKLEIGYLPYTPSFGIVLLNPNEPEGVCFVEIYHHKATVHNATFVLTAARDSKWYEFFSRQYELLWESCRTEELSK